jgi:hypothetical protein
MVVKVQVEYAEIFPCSPTSVGGGLCSAEQRKKKVIGPAELTLPVNSPPHPLLRPEDPN